MPVFLFTWHAYGSWLPDRPEGYVKRDLGLLPPDPDMAGSYRQNMTQGPVFFDESIQRLLIETALDAATYQRLEVYGVGSDPSHLHEVCAWRDERSETTVAAQLKRSLTAALNKAARSGEIAMPDRAGDAIRWFAGNTHRKRVRDEKHRRYLREEYLPDHAGWCWDCRHGYRPPKRR